MKISARNFIASQALYGLMISKPKMSKKKMVKKAYQFSKLMLKESIKYAE